MNRSHSLMLLLAAAAVLGFSASSASAGTPGAFDASFGLAGTTLFGDASTRSEVVDVEVTAKGRIITAFNTNLAIGGGKAHGTLFALKPSGRIDRAFGRRGKVVISSGQNLLDVAKSSADDFYAVDEAGVLHAVDRDGKRVDSFGANGSLDLGTMAPACKPQSLAVQRSGRVVVSGTAASPAGTTEPRTPCLIGLTAQGALDPSFGDHGVATLEAARSGGGRLAVTTKDEIFLGVTSKPDPVTHRQNSAVAKLNANGAPVATFGSGGVYILPSYNDVFSGIGVSNLAIGGSGGIFVQAEDVPGCGGRGCFPVATAYALDGNGLSLKKLPEASQATGFAVGKDGKLIGISSPEDFYDDPYPEAARVMRFTAGGELDLSFNRTGSNTATIEQAATAGAVTVAPDGKIIVAGGSEVGQYFNHVFVSRYLGSSRGDSAAQVRIDGEPLPGHFDMVPLDLSGTAGPSKEVRSVGVAVERTSKTLARHGSCQWIKDRKLHVVKRRLHHGKCPDPVFIRAAGASKWGIRFQRGLRYGRYQLWARATLASGRRTPMTESRDSHWSFSVAGG